MFTHYRAVFSILLLSVLVLIVAEEGTDPIPIDPCRSRTCPDNEEFTLCGSRCEPSCARLNEPCIGPLVCLCGCFCRANYARNDTGACIPREHCPRKQPNYGCGCGGYSY